MNLLFDEYRVKWAIKYLHEAELNIITAQNESSIDLGIYLAIFAIKKIQLALYYLFGDPSYLNSLVKSNLDAKKLDPVMKHLVQVESLIQIITSKTYLLNNVDNFNKIKKFIEINSQLIKKILKKTSYLKKDFETDEIKN